MSLPKPYYHDEKAGITIYNADCRDILPHLSSIDLVLTDPPYGINYQSNSVPAWRRKDKIHGDHEFPVWIFEAITPSVAFMVWCRWDTLYSLPRPKSFIVWDKGAHSMGDLKHEFGIRWEAIAFYPGPKHEFLKRPMDLIVAARVNPLNLLHPNEKPVAAILPLLECHPGDVVLDPFIGSGTTLRAAKDIGRKAIGIEISERFCEIAAKRLAQGVLFT